MNETRDPEEILLAWLDEGPLELPAGTRSAIVTALPGVRRARDERRPWAASRPRTFLTAAAGIAAIALMAALIGLKPGSPNDVAAPIATPSAPIPTLPLMKQDWLSVGSSRFGYEVELPASWRPEPPVGDLPPALFPGSPVSHGDRLRTPGVPVPLVIIATADLGPRNLLTWTATWDRVLERDCTVQSTENVTVAGAPARLRTRTCGTALAIDVVVPHAQQVVLLRWASDGYQPADERAVFDRILASFRFSAKP